MLGVAVGVGVGVGVAVGVGLGVEAGEAGFDVGVAVGFSVGVGVELGVGEVVGVGVGEGGLGPNCESPVFTPWTCPVCTTPCGLNLWLKASIKLAGDAEGRVSEGSSELAVKKTIRAKTEIIASNTRMETIIWRLYSLFQGIFIEPIIPKNPAQKRTGFMNNSKDLFFRTNFTIFRMCNGYINCRHANQNINHHLK